VEVGDEHTDGVRASLHEAAGDGVGLVPQFAGKMTAAAMPGAVTGSMTDRSVRLHASLLEL
jgi:hypothetical protein